MSKLSMYHERSRNVTHCDGIIGTLSTHKVGGAAAKICGICRVAAIRGLWDYEM
jgi:hypothetical protein